METNDIPADGDLILRAKAFATRAHGSIQQIRKYSGEPYITHPEAVARIVSEVTDDPLTIAAAWLHDVVEDTPVSLEEILREFGEEVTRLVSDLTDVARPADGHRAARVAINRYHTALADPRAKTVKLADVIHNVGEMMVQNPGYAPRYAAEKRLLLEVLRDGDARLWSRAWDVVCAVIPEEATPSADSCSTPAAE